jgi:hypothetical protein
MDNVTNLRQWKENKELEKHEDEMRRIDRVVRIAIEKLKRDYTGEYQVLLESRAGMFKRLSFFGLPPERWRMPVPTSPRAMQCSEAISPYAPMPEILEFRLVAVKGTVLHYREIY